MEKRLCPVHQILVYVIDMIVNLQLQEVSTVR